MTEPQVWTLIGVFGTALFGMLTLMSTMFVRILRAEIGTVRAEIGSDIGALRSEMHTDIGALRTEMHTLHRETTTKLELLDRDVQAIARRVFGDDAA